MSNGWIFFWLIVAALVLVANVILYIKQIWVVGALFAVPTGLGLFLEWLDFHPHWEGNGGTILIIAGWVGVIITPILWSLWRRHRERCS